eukprot:992866_1
MCNQYMNAKHEDSLFEQRGEREESRDGFMTSRNGKDEKEQENDTFIAPINPLNGRLDAEDEDALFEADEEEEEEEKIETAMMTKFKDTMPYDETTHRSISNPTYPMQNTTTPRNTNRHKGGTIYYQCAHFTAQQCQTIANNFDANKRAAPLLLFGENNVDKTRAEFVGRQYSGGQAEFVGPYWFSYGIVTTWKDVPAPAFGVFQGLMNEQFKPLADHLRNGKDIIVPTPQNPNKYFDGNRVWKVKHNLGTGIAKLSIKYLMYIQFKLEELEHIASEINRISYCKTYADEQEQDNDVKMFDVAAERGRKRDRKRGRDTLGVTCLRKQDVFAKQPDPKRRRLNVQLALQ